MDTIIEAILIFLGTILLVAVFALIMALPTMWLWNWLMPEIFGLTTLGFWQALGVNLLSGFLFKSSHSSKSSD